MLTYVITYDTIYSERLIEQLFLKIKKIDLVGKQKKNGPSLSHQSGSMLLNYNINPLIRKKKEVS